MGAAWLLTLLALAGVVTGVLMGQARKLSTYLGAAGGGLLFGIALFWLLPEIAQNSGWAIALHTHGDCLWRGAATRPIAGTHRALAAAGCGWTAVGGSRCTQLPGWMERASVVRPAAGACRRAGWSGDAQSSRRSGAGMDCAQVARLDVEGNRRKRRGGSDDVGRCVRGTARKPIGECRIRRMVDGCSARDHCGRLFVFGLACALARLEAAECCAAVFGESGAGRNFQVLTQALSRGGCCLWKSLRF